LQSPTSADPEEVYIVDLEPTWVCESRCVQAEWGPILKTGNYGKFHTLKGGTVEAVTQGNWKERRPCQRKGRGDLKILGQEEVQERLGYRCAHRRPWLSGENTEVPGDVEVMCLTGQGIRSTYTSHSG
jgi:hypothetical protein